MAAPATSNRRLFYRQPMFVRVDLRVAGFRVPIPATVVDLSGGGCALVARTMLKAHTQVEFVLPRPDAPPLRLNGRLVKVNYVPSDRTFRYAMSFEATADDVHDELLRFISHEQRRNIAAARGEELERAPAAPTRPQQMRAERRIEVNIPVRYSVPDTNGILVGTALDLSTGGARIITDRVLRQEWNVLVRFNLPNGDSNAELRANARPLPGVKTLRGRYVHSLAWANPDPRFTDEIDRFVQHMRLATMRRG